MLRSILIASFVLAPASVALAQPDEGTEPPVAEEEASPEAPIVPETPAQPEAPPPPKVGVTLPAGALEIAVNVEINMSAEAVAKPISIAPDVAYGVNDDLTVALIHSQVGITGFRARTGRGLCLTGEDNGCLEVYNNVGAEAWYRLGGGTLALAAVAGVHAVNLDGGFYDAKLGLKLRYPVTPELAIVSHPSVLVAMTERTDELDNRLNRDSLWIPVQAVYKVSPQLSAGLGTGLKTTDLSAFGDTWEIPLGVMGTYKIDPALSVGASWVFNAVVGGAENPDTGPGITGFDQRGLQIWGVYRL